MKSLLVQVVTEYPPLVQFPGGWKIDTACVLFSAVILLFIPAFVGLLSGKKAIIKNAFFCQLVLVTAALLFLSQWTASVAIAAIAILFLRKKILK